MISRRKTLQLLATGFGAPMLPKFSPTFSVGSGAGGPKRVIFFMQNQGFDPATCVPSGMKHVARLRGP